jgi:hypothetical protein
MDVIGENTEQEHCFNAKLDHGHNLTEKSNANLPYFLHHYVIKFVSDLRQVSDFVESDVKHHNPIYIYKSDVKHHNPIYIYYEFSLLHIFSLVLQP